MGWGINLRAHPWQKDARAEEPTTNQFLTTNWKKEQFQIVRERERNTLRGMDRTGILENCMRYREELRLVWNDEGLSKWDIVMDTKFCGFDKRAVHEEKKEDEWLAERNNDKMMVLTLHSWALIDLGGIAIGRKFLRKEERATNFQCG